MQCEDAAAPAVAHVMSPAEAMAGLVAVSRAMSAARATAYSIAVMMPVRCSRAAMSAAPVTACLVAVMTRPRATSAAQARACVVAALVTPLARAAAAMVAAPTAFAIAAAAKAERCAQASGSKGRARSAAALQHAVRSSTSRAVHLRAPEPRVACPDPSVAAAAFAIHVAMRSAALVRAASLAMELSAPEPPRAPHCRETSSDPARGLDRSHLPLTISVPPRVSIIVDRCCRSPRCR
jgi:hypothetical protein